MPLAPPFNFKAWIDAHRDRLKPPVCNQQVYQDSDFIIMVIGGPNCRKDYHWDPGEEWFFQLEGDMLLKTVQDGGFVDVPIREGEIFLLPSGVPHSPQRFADTVGLVVERKRRPDEQDGFMWYCDGCGTKLHDVYLHVTDIVGQLPPLFESFWADDRKRTCSACGARLERP